MLDKLKAKKAEIAALRDERGATDPILIIAGIAITLILLVGGSFAIAGFMNNARDLNAKGDLDRVATAQAAYMAENDGFAADGGTLPGGGADTRSAVEKLQESSIGFNVTDGNALEIVASEDGWVAATKSASGTVFVRSSEGTAIVAAADAGTLTLPTGVNTAAVTALIASVN